MVALRKDVPIQAFTGLAAPVIRALPPMARFPVGLDIMISVPSGAGYEVKRVQIRSTSVDRFGNRFYSGFLNSNHFFLREDRLEKLLGVKQNDAFAPSY